MGQSVWEWRERWQLLRGTVAKAEAVFGTISLLWGLHIFTFGGVDIVACAMKDVMPIQVWGLLLIGVGLTQGCAAFYAQSWLRSRATFANMAIMLFVSVAFVRGHLWTPGVFICPGYTLWLYEIYRYLGANTDAKRIE